MYIQTYFSDIVTEMAPLAATISASDTVLTYVVSSDVSSPSRACAPRMESPQYVGTEVRSDLLPSFSRSTCRFKYRSSSVSPTLSWQTGPSSWVRTGPCPRGS